MPLYGSVVVSGSMPSTVTPASAVLESAPVWPGQSYAGVGVIPGLPAVFNPIQGILEPGAGEEAQKALTPFGNGRTIIIPPGGLTVQGVAWPAGAVNLFDEAWAELLINAGATEITAPSMVRVPGQGWFVTLPNRLGTPDSSTVPQPIPTPSGPPPLRFVARPRTLNISVAVVVDGVPWPAGLITMTDTGWIERLLQVAGVTEVGNPQALYTRGKGWG